MYNCILYSLYMWICRQPTALLMISPLLSIPRPPMPKLFGISWTDTIWVGFKMLFYKMFNLLAIHLGFQGGNTLRVTFCVPGPCGLVILNSLKASRDLKRNNPSGGLLPTPIQKLDHLHFSGKSLGELNLTFFMMTLPCYIWWELILAWWCVGAGLPSRLIPFVHFFAIIGCKGDLSPVSAHP